MYYLQHQSEFVRAVPATQPSTRPATTQSASTQPVGPTTRPFAEVKDDIIHKLVDPDTKALSDRITAALNKRLTDDYASYRLANPATRPTTSVATDLVTVTAVTQPTGYGSFAYLEEVAAGYSKTL